MKKQERVLAIKMREQGASLRDIKDMLNISLSSASEWVKNVELSEGAKNKIQKKIIDGRKKSNAVLRARGDQRKKDAEDFAKSIIKNIKINSDVKKIILSLIYWCEGNKKGFLNFTNSDPQLISMFIKVR